ncbi:MAG: hypothetical protein H0W74_06900 [Sphingosinicella sp.]|nr:hypothetical protein [Sphingosinicella sp.]
MKRWRSKLLLLGGVTSLGLAIPALSQDSDAPESLLPPGFEDPQPPQDEAQNQQVPVPPARPTAEPQIQVIDAAEEDLPPLEDLDVAPAVEIPDFARRSTDIVGTMGPANWGLGEGAFGGADGRLLSTLMRRLDAPLPSRWTSILLRRALLSRVPAPPNVHPVDWVAERAWLLLRMGEADGARMLVQSVDVGQFTPKMFSVAVQTALATADPAALCPLVESGRKTSDEPVWPLSDAICAALAGQASKASTLIDQARRRGTARGIDLLLTEKMVGAGANTRRAVTLQWDDVNELSTWRFGLAAATGAEIPARLIGAAPPQMRAWHARAPMVPIDQRIDAAESAATLGVFSNASLIEMYSQIADAADVTEIAGSVGGTLRIAYAGRTTNARVEAIRKLWDQAENPSDRYARQILTAVAASRIVPDEKLVGDVPDLLASMFAAGVDRDSARWANMIGELDGRAQARAWALLAVGSPRPAVDITGGWVGGYRENDDSPGNYKSKLLVAALAGLGRVDEAEAADLAGDMEVDLLREDRWTRMLDSAAHARQPGTVALLAAAAMQTPHWRGVPPRHFYRIIRALRQVGLEYEARMIAAEALSRA